MRLCSWNVRSLRDDARGVARVLRALDADVVCLQEAPRLLLWRTSRLLLARRAGLTRGTRGQAHGLAVLAGRRTVVRSSYDLGLPHRPGLHRRGLAAAHLEVGGRPIAVVTTHLDLEPSARLDSARRVRSALPTGPVVLTGDVNEEPGGPAWAALGAGLTDARHGLGPTFPASAPERRLDGVWVSPGLAVVRAEVVVAAGVASDHLPLLVELDW